MQRPVSVIVRGPDAANRLVRALTATTCTLITPRAHLRDRKAATWLFRVDGTTKPGFEDVLMHDLLVANMVGIQYSDGVSEVH
jgi:hypothetical protein